MVYKTAPLCSFLIKKVGRDLWKKNRRVPANPAKIKLRFTEVAPLKLKNKVLDRSAIKSGLTFNNLY